MRNPRRIAAIVLAAAAALTFAAGCTASSDGSTQHAKATPTAKPAATPITNLHWLDTDNAKPPANLENLRRAVEELGFDLSRAGYSPIGEYVDNDQHPTVLVTLWLSKDGTNAVELNSKVGMQAITVRRDVSPANNGNHTVWFRCAYNVPNPSMDAVAEAKKVNAYTTAQLYSESCQIVTFG